MILYATIITSCGKIKDDLSGSEEMTGKLYIQNVYDSLPKKLVPMNEVFLQESALSTNYLFSVKSDKDGFFLFDYVKKQAYNLHAEIRQNTRLDNNVLFTVDSTLSPGSNLELIMTPDFKKQNGAYFICKDTANPVGNLPYDTIYLYTSRILAVNDSSLITGAGASFKFATRLDGTALKMNLPSGIPLYINAACTYGNTRFRCKLADLQLNATGFLPVTLQLK